MAVTPESNMEHDPQLAAVYRAGSGEEPPSHLDAAIRAAARREVNAGPARPGKARFGSWGVPLSLAAVVVVSVSVVLMMQQEGADRLESLTRPMPAEIAPRAVDAGSSNEAARSPAVEEAVPQRMPAPVPGPAPAAVRPGRAKTVAEPVPQPAAKQRDNEAAPRALESSAARATPASEADYTQGGLGAKGERASATPAPSLLRSAPAPITGESAAVAGSADPRAPAAALADAPAKAALWRDLVDAPPEKWLQRIGELRRAGKSADAAAVVAEFRRRFPAERVPEELG